MVNTDKLFPENFRELLSAVMLIFAIVFCCISFFKSPREHSLRMAGLFLLGSLSLLAHNGWSYFAAVFIVATAVTQTGFLQNLAAIIRGNKDYFDYQKEFLTRSEVKSSIVKEDTEIESATAPELEDKSNQNIVSLMVDKTNLSIAEFGLLVEDYTFKFLEKKYGKPIQRHVRYKGKNIFAEFDGVMETGSTDLIFEIKISRKSNIPVNIMIQSIETKTKQISEYEITTKRKANLRFILIGDFAKTYATNVSTKYDETVKNITNINVVIETYTFEEIGLADLVTEPSIKVKKLETSK